MTRQQSPWVILLAGGDGRRLDGAVVRGLRLDRPKQFCCFGKAGSMLRETLRRAERITHRSRILAVVREDHRHWWLDDLSRLPSQNVLAQAENRGTAVAILHALVHVLRRDQDPTLVILPSDHAVDDESVLVDSIRLATTIAGDSHEHLVLLGMVPEHAECEYGWILPEGEDHGRARQVARFEEKPPPRLAAALFSEGALWNSFISAVSGNALLELFEGCQPALLRRYLDSCLAAEADKVEGSTLFRSLPIADFSRDIIQAASIRLRVLAVPPCGWTDLGTPRRLDQWLGRGSVGPMAGHASAV